MGLIQQAIHNRGWDDGLLRHRARQVLRKSQLARFLPARGRFLDLGSGLGHVTEAVLSDAPDRVSVMMDPGQSLSPWVARRLGSRARLTLKGSAIHLPFRDATFDGAWSAFVLHHVLFEGQEAILDEIRRVLKPSGAFVLLEDTPSTPQEFETTLLADRRLNAEPEEAPHHYRSPAEWRADLPRHGFAVDQEIAFSRLFPVATLKPVHHRAFICRRG